MSEYESFIENKHFKQVEAGFDYVVPADSRLRDYQRETVQWALARGKAAIFKDTGLGKTLDELEFAHAVVHHTNQPVLLLAPLSVGYQINRLADEFGYETKIVRSMADVENTICITNYENLHNIDFGAFSGIVLDESSILKGMNGKVRKQLTDGAQCIPYRLSCTATPAPNDLMEIGTQSEFLGLMTQTEMLATFFIHDGGDTAKWRLKGHGRQKFYEWLATWSVIMRDPSDYGFNSLPELPPLHIHQVEVETDPTTGLFVDIAQSLSERITARRDTMQDRCAKAAEIISELDGPVLVWCNLNAEGDLLEKLIKNSVQVSGSDKDDHKVNAVNWFIGYDDYVINKNGKVEKCLNQSTLRNTTGSTEIKKLPQPQSGNQKTKNTERNTCASTQKQIGRNSPEHQSSSLNTISGAEKSTLQILSTETKKKQKLQSISEEIQKNDSQTGLENTESLQTTTGRCYQSKTTDVLYADHLTLHARKKNDCMLTIATPVERSEDCFAQTAITDSENSTTIQNYSEQRQDTSKRVLISKPRMFGYGLNLQHCNQMVFVGLSDSFEAYYQAVRRCWRQGQSQEVNVWVITADIEGAVVANIKRKQIHADETMGQMSKIASTFFSGFTKAKNELRQYNPAIAAPKPMFKRSN